MNTLEKVALATTLKELDDLREEVAADCQMDSTQAWQEKYRALKIRGR